VVGSGRAGGLGEGAAPPVGGQGRAGDGGGLAVSSMIDPSCRCWFCTNRYKIETCAVVGAFDGRSVAVKLHEQTLLVPYRGAALDGAVRGSCQPNAAGFREGAVRSA